jgi:2-polyprenyl-3-methyl-5-hydroxy-6-metoxy-1,4-benzoquinol methylase
MFNNWINIHDLGRIKEKIVRGEWQPFLKKISANAQGRTRLAWAHTQNPPLYAWDIPAVRSRWNVLVSGAADIDHVAYICRKYLGGKSNLTALSPGCGSGSNEMHWAETGLFKHIDACDLSPQRIAKARAGAEQKNLTGIINFTVGDMQAITGAGPYDMVIAEGALHHFYPMRTALEKINSLLKPGGMLIVNEFVGPSRFQWTMRQLQAANAMLALIPKPYKQRWHDGKTKMKVTAPGRLRMKLADPSEAAQSALILPQCREMFTSLEEIKKGGALINLVFFEIAHHFLQADEPAATILQTCFAIEDMLMQSGEISSDYILAIFQKPRL